MYTDQTGRYIKTRIKEHQLHCNKEITEKLPCGRTLVYVRGKPIHFRDTEELQESSAYLESIVKESIEIALHENITSTMLRVTN